MQDDMEYSKSKLALIQLERAIELFFEDKDYVCSITLAGASEDITRGMERRGGLSTAVGDLEDWLKANHPNSDLLHGFYKKANETRNMLKHFSVCGESHVFVGIDEAKYWLIRALINYDRSHAVLTKPMFELISWIKQENA